MLARNVDFIAVTFIALGLLAFSKLPQFALPQFALPQVPDIRFERAVVTNPCPVSAFFDR